MLNLPGMPPFGSPNWSAQQVADIKRLWDDLIAAIDVPLTGPDVASATTIALDPTKKSAVITGSVTIDNISGDGWFSGQGVTLVFSAACIVRHNQAATGIPIVLATGVDFGATINDTLTLLLIAAPSEAALRWMEIARTSADAANAYTVTNVTPDRAYDANAVTIDELADVLGSLIADLKARGIIG